MRRIDADHATTTALDPRVRQAIEDVLAGAQSSPSSLHRRGDLARSVLDEARRAVGDLLDCPPDEILFAASATEANNLAIKGVALAGPRDGLLLAAATEHLSVLHPLRSLEKAGHRVDLLPVDRFGLLVPGDVERALSPGTVLLSVGHASAEIGTIQPVGEIGALARARGVLVHVDATTTAGLLPPPPDAADLTTLTAHLLHGPQGIAALRVRRGVSLRPLIEGGTQEGGLRAGAEPVALIAGFGVAARLARAERADHALRARRLAATFLRVVHERLRGFVLTGHPDQRIPGHVSLCVDGIEAEAALTALDAEGIEAASGSACTTQAAKRSHVLEAIGIGEVLSRGALTFAFAHDNQDDDPGAAALALVRIAGRLRELRPD